MLSNAWRKELSDNLKRPSFSDMSSHQRAQSLDNMARQISELTAATNALQSALSQAAVHAASEYTKVWTLIRMHEARIDAHAGILLRPTLFARLRWLLLGK